MTVIHRLIGASVFLGSVWYALSAVAPALRLMKRPDTTSLLLASYCVLAAYAGIRMLRR